MPPSSQPSEPLTKAGATVPIAWMFPRAWGSSCRELRQSFRDPKDTSGTKPGLSDNELLCCQKIKFCNFLMQSPISNIQPVFLHPSSPLPKKENSHILASTWTHLPNDFLHLEAAQCLITSVRTHHNAWFQRPGGSLYSGTRWWPCSSDFSCGALARLEGPPPKPPRKLILSLNSDTGKLTETTA